MIVNLIDVMVRGIPCDPSDDPREFGHYIIS